MLPRDCDLEAGADAVTWDVGRHLFGEQEQQVRLHEVSLKVEISSLGED
jgi:hypothetical protein